MRTARLSILVALAALAGCGGTSGSTTEFEGEEKRVAQVIEDLQEAAGEDASRRICQTLLSSEATGNIPGGDCEKTIDQALEDADNFDLAVDDVTISGTTATARVKAGRDEDQVETIKLVKEGELWKISQLAGAGS